MKVYWKKLNNERGSQRFPSSIQDGALKNPFDSKTLDKKNLTVTFLINLIKIEQKN